MKRRILAIGLFLVIIAAAATCYNVNKKSRVKVDAQAACAVRTEMRKLWTDHAFWTREVIICLVDNTPGKDAAIDRLLKNQDELGASIVPYYNDIAGKELTRLLREHIIIAADVIVAARDNNEQALKIAKIKWNTNAEEIAEFLSNANPNLEYAEVKYMMDYHLKLTTNEVLSRVNKKYDKNVEDFDKVYYEALEMSDMISSAIVKQFPEKFQCEDSGSNH